jgi:hypothetical protein
MVYKQIKINITHDQLKKALNGKPVSFKKEQLGAGTNYLSGGSLPVAGAIAGIAYPAVRSQFTKLGQHLDRKTNVDVANLASSVGEAREALIQALQAHIPQSKLTMGSKLKLSLPTQP